MSWFLQDATALFQEYINPYFKRLNSNEASAPKLRAAFKSERAERRDELRAEIRERGETDERRREARRRGIASDGSVRDGAGPPPHG